MTTKTEGQRTARTIYLAGPINGRTDEECNNWRSIAKQLWQGPTLDPMSRDYRGREDEPGIEVEIVRGDKFDIAASDGVLLYFVMPSVGTSMEALYAWTIGRPVVVVNASMKPLSPWLRYHATAVANDLVSGIALLSTHLESNQS
jgi:hypothetical protein